MLPVDQLGWPIFSSAVINASEVGIVGGRKSQASTQQLLDNMSMLRLFCLPLSLLSKGPDDGVFDDSVAVHTHTYIHTCTLWEALLLARMKSFKPGQDLFYYDYFIICIEKFT